MTLTLPPWIDLQNDKKNDRKTICYPFSVLLQYKRACPGIYPVCLSSGKRRKSEQHGYFVGLMSVGF
jgi:hypothetical protein